MLSIRFEKNIEGNKRCSIHLKETRGYIDEHQIKMIDMKFCDLWGRWHHLSVPTSQFNTDLLTQGIGFDGSAVGLKSVKAGDMVLVPDLATGALDLFGKCPP